MVKKFVEKNLVFFFLKDFFSSFTPTRQDEKFKVYFAEWNND